MSEEGVKNDQALEQPPKKEMWAWGVGSFGTFTIWTLIGSFLTYYYTDVAGLAAGAVGTLMLVARLMDGVTDLGMGSFVDKTRSKHGSARPWLLWMGVPLGVATVLLFSVPDLGDTGKLVYAYVTYILFILVYTSVTIPHKTLMGVMTQDQHSRSLINIYAQILILSGTLLTMVISEPLAQVVGWTVVASIYGVIVVIALLITFKSVKERTELSTLSGEDGVAAKEGFKALLKNKYWIIVTLFCVVSYAIMALIQGAGIYYASWIIGDSTVFSFIGAALILPMILGLFFLGPLVKKYGKKNIIIVGSSISIIGQLVRMIEPENLTIFLIGTAIVGIGYMPTIAFVFALTNETIEYGQYKTGIRSPGIINSGTSFGMKVGTGVGMALIGWLLGMSGYIGTADAQPQIALNMIITLNIYIPLVLAIVQIVLMLFYRLDREYPKVVEELKRK
ncbi:GPH family glycoside/pentoside/hexuronide:cation symporter [Alkalibacillus filiformis]|uniref:GPH family glycoside/pentoside/hexuronide:cation symporter n=1 Tax=Alkalibacillus filiformis TaxID=200990 RepID=A0ABU0DU11_9BACI|nr:glycoside-pentoside-hexuronide (GPH):cation symporter [Alkalibacillus filiformis]MDQ0351953.1 GPH family glycoside/pentoside/hexuronide:cation symporter [Alkalibacillus filiformis]